MNSAHWNGGSQSEHSVVQGCTVLPFRKQTMSNQRSEFSVSQPYRGQIRVAAASAGHQVETHYPVFAAITFGPFHAQFVKASEVVLADGRYGRAVFCRLHEDSKGLQYVNLFIRHLCHQLREL